MSRNLIKTSGGRIMKYGPGDLDLNGRFILSHQFPITGSTYTVSWDGWCRRVNDVFAHPDLSPVSLSTSDIASQLAKSGVSDKFVDKGGTVATPYTNNNFTVTISWSASDRHYLIKFSTGISWSSAYVTYSRHMDDGILGIYTHYAGNATDETSTNVQLS